MILGLGVDICDVRRMERAIRSDHFVRRVFRPEEISYADGKGKGRAASYASAFAAREAFSKAAGVSMYKLALSSRFCLDRSEGIPRLIVPPEVDADFSARKKLAWVSISHDGSYVVVVVAIEKAAGDLL